MKSTDEEFMRKAQALIDQPWKWIKGAGSKLTFDPDGNQIVGRCMSGALEATIDWTQPQQHQQFLRAHWALQNVVYDETGVASVSQFNDHHATHDQVMVMFEKAAAKLAEMP